LWLWVCRWRGTYQRPKGICETTVVRQAINPWWTDWNSDCLLRGDDWCIEEWFWSQKFSFEWNNGCWDEESEKRFSVPDLKNGENWKNCWVAGESVCWDAEDEGGSSFDNEIDFNVEVFGCCDGCDDFLHFSYKLQLAAAILCSFSGLLFVYYVCPFLWTCYCLI